MCVYIHYIPQVHGVHFAAYQTSQLVVPRGGILLSKWRSSFAGSSDGKMNVQSTCAMNTRYNYIPRLKNVRRCFRVQ
jgi:hypothetical protein